MLDDVAEASDVLVELGLDLGHLNWVRLDPRHLGKTIGLLEVCLER